MDTMEHKTYYDAAQMINAVLTQIPAADLQRYMHNAAACSESVALQDALLLNSRSPLHWLDNAQLSVSLHASYTNFYHKSHDIYEHSNRVEGSLG